MSERRLGILSGLGAYGLWGLFPLYWPLLEPAGALEILGHRIFWSLVTMGLLVMALGRWPVVRGLFADRRVFQLCDLMCGRLEAELRTRGKLLAS